MAVAVDPGTPRPGRARGLRVLPAQARADALRRIVAEVSGTLDLDAVFADVLDSSCALFGATHAGLWLIDPGDRPLRLVAQRGLDSRLVDTVARIRAGSKALGLEAIRRHRPIVVTDPASAPRLGPIYRRLGFRTVNFVPLVFHEEPVGLLVLYHDVPYDWTADELDLARSFADQMAIAVANARLWASVRDLEARLKAIQELSSRLNRIQDVEGIGEAIVAEADRLIVHDTIRVYRVDDETGWCEPIAFHGEFLGIGRPSADMLRVRIGEGLTGWVAAHAETVRIGNASADPRGRRVGGDRGPESMLLVPVIWESRVLGVIVVSAVGDDRFTDDDQRTLEIFAGHAAQAIVNAQAFGQVRSQQDELQHRLESQRRLLQVNERLLSTLDPGGVLEMIADSLKAVMTYDSLTIYRVDRAAGVRRAVVARDRFADLILQHEGSLEVGITGWAIQHREAVLANDAHRDPRSINIPGTPEEPESLIVCPLVVGGEVIGTLNLARMGGEESHFSHDEFELVQLFAGQASIALRNAEAHGAMVIQAEHDALTGLRNHGAFQRELGEAVARDEPFALLMIDLDAFKTYNDTLGHPAGDALLARIGGAMRSAVRDGDRLYRYGGDEFAILLPRATAKAASDVGSRVRAAIVALTATTEPRVGASVGVAHFPDDGATKDALVEAADNHLYLAKPVNRARDARDPFLAALDETTLRVLERLDPQELLEAIVLQATALVGVAHGYLYLAEGEGDDAALVVRVGTGIFRDHLGYSLPRGEGIGWEVVRTGQPCVVEDYAAYARPAAGLPVRRFGAVAGVPLTSGGQVVGVIGLASGDRRRRFSEREVAALVRFAQLASVAVDNARLFEHAEREGRTRAHAALHDALTGLPNRIRLVDELNEALGPGATDDEAAEDGHGAPADDRARRSDPAPVPDAPGATPDAMTLGLVLIDLDRFKTVNETLGHTAGDHLLIEVGHRLSELVGPADTVARLGSDEFGVLLRPDPGRRSAHRLALDAEARLAAPYDIAGHEVTIGASLGLAFGERGVTSAADLLREAEMALHRAKTDAHRRTIVFDPEMRAETLERAGLERDLRRAIEREELVLHYQPIIELDTGRVAGLEALLRWQHPTRGLVGPMAFVPLAEETGLILPIGAWVVETACRQVRAWRDRFPGARPVVSVNLSARQFAQPELALEIAGILDRTGVPPGALHLEITESVAMDQSEEAVERLQLLRSLGIRLVLDDFGTGYSSLAYLRRLPLDTIKIDRSFVAGIAEDTTDRSIVAAVIALAHGLGIGVVAEGIETDGQLAALQALGCDRGQGYLFARPLPAGQLDDVIAGRTSPAPRADA